MTKAVIVGILAEHDLHPGAGQGLGAIDQPVQREGGTGFPVVPNSSHKGALKSAVTGGDRHHHLLPVFGDDAQGSVAFPDFRLLLLPMRCSESSYKWVTSRLLLERLAREAHRFGYQVEPMGSVSWPAPGRVLSAAPLPEKTLHVEEHLFTVDAGIPPQLAKLVQNLIPPEPPYDTARARVAEQMLVMNDSDFAWFCRYGLPVRPHNALDPGTKASLHFWYEEYLPADTLMYSSYSQLSAGASRGLKDLLADLAAPERQWIQFGGNESTGEGVCRVHVWQPPAGGGRGHG